MDSTTNTWGNKLIDICVSHNLCLLNGRTLGDLNGSFTFFCDGQSSIDLTVVDSQILSNTLGFKVHPFLPYYSSHCKIETILACKPIPNCPDETINQNLNFVKYTWNNECSRGKLCEAIKSPTFANLKNRILLTDYNANATGTDALHSDVERLSNYLHESCCDKVNIGKKSHSKVRRKKWFTPDLQSLRKRVRRAANYFHRNPFSVRAREEVFSLNRQYKKLLKRTKKQHMNSNLNKLINCMDRNEMWPLLSELRGQKAKSSIPMKDLHQHFNNILNNPPINVLESKIKFLEGKVQEYLNSSNTENCLPEGGYSCDFIKKTAKTLKNGKSSFLDGSINEVLKYSINDTAPIFAKLFNQIESSASFPSSWKCSFLVPLHKKGNRSDPENYRGLAVGNNISKLYTKCLNSKMMNFAEENHLLSPHQFAFRQDYRTSDAIFSLQSSVNYYKHKNKPVYCCFVDFSKAFDSINRTALIYKLGTIGIKGNMLKLLINMYNSSDYIIKSDGKYSSPINSKFGVKQGCNLSPLLFNLFVNDIHSIFEDCKPLNINDWKISSLSFADDLVLLSESESGLRKCLQKLESYCADWGLKVNPTKTKVMVFNKKFTKNIKKLYFDIDQNPIEVTNSYLYLGVEITNTGNFTKASDVLYKKALKALFSIYSSLDVRSDERNASLFIKLFDSLVKPVLLYGCEIWGSIAKSPKNVINKFVNKFYKTLLGVPQHTSTAGIHAELGRFPIFTNIQQAMTKFWFRLVTLPKSRLVSHCYWSLFNLNPRNDPWFNEIKNIFTSTGQQFIWDCQASLSSFHPRYISAHIKYICQTLQDISLQETNEKIDNETKLKFFRNSKPSNKLPNYVKILSGRKKRSSLSKFRLGTLDLEIEKGRRKKNIPRSERICKICNSKQPEDEIHFILSCPALSSHRDPYIPKITSFNKHFTYLSDEEKVQYLYFNESLPTDTLETAATLLETLIERRQFLLNSIEYKYLN